MLIGMNKISMTKKTTSKISKGGNFKALSLAVVIGCMFFCAEDANAQEKVIVKAGDTYNESSLVFKELKGATGGAFSNGGESNINEFTFNKDTGTTAGGAVFNKGILNVISSMFNNNEATYTKGYGGGAIYNQKELTVSNSEFTGNKAKVYGGAIFNFANGTINGLVKINGNTIFSGNDARYYGGAIYNGNGGTVEINGTDKNNRVEFNENTSRYYGSAIYNLGNLIINNAKFYGNKSEWSSAIYNEKASKFEINNSIFENNYGISYGAAGAIHLKSENTDVISTIKNSTFTGNHAHYNDGKNMSFGGAVGVGLGHLEIDNTEFNGNHATHSGAIQITLFSRSKGQTVEDVSVKITNSKLHDNWADTSAGAIGNFSTLIAEKTLFENNEARTTEYEGGGALFLGSESETTLDEVIFQGNNSLSNGGAIATRTSELGYNAAAKLDIMNSKFINNTAAGNGGAFDNYFYGSSDKDGSVLISNTTFEGNSANEGGAVYNHEKGENAVANAGDAAVHFKNALFKGNNAVNNGGAIHNNSIIELTDTSFINNTAGKDGGAIYSTEDIRISAVNDNVIFSGNKAENGSDIYVSKENGNIYLNAANDKSITLEGGISGNQNGYNIIINNNLHVMPLSLNPDVNNNIPESDNGTVAIKSAINNAAIHVQNGTLHLAEGSKLNNTTVNMSNGTTLNTINNQIDNYGNNITLNDNVKVFIDVNTANKTSDDFSNAIQNGSVTLEDINIVNTTHNYNDPFTMDLSESMGLRDVNIDVKISDHLLSQELRVLTPIRWMYGSINKDSIINYGPTGNKYNDFNPAVMASSIAAQLGGYLTQLNSYDEAFRNMDMYMLMTKEQRQAMKNANKYAAADSNLVFDPINTPYTDKAGWFRPYATFESVNLKDGPRVNNTAYGTFAGLESEMYDLGNGWDGIFSLYAGYNGSHQSYQGNSISQNGGTLGLIGMFYKENFFTGITANVGSSIADASTMYGNEDFTMLMTGIASKTGYNWELADGKFIIQPSYLMSYSLVNTFDYTNAAGVKINSDPLHAIQIEPGLKFIGNLKNGWQPYAGVSVVMTLMDKSQFTANDISLPELSVKPFVKYGVGVRKTWGERFTGFVQTFLTSGGRNGVGIQTGFRWTLGKKPAKHTNSSGEKKYIKAKV